MRPESSRQERGRAVRSSASSAIARFRTTGCGSLASVYGTKGANRNRRATSENVVFRNEWNERNERRFSFRSHKANENRELRIILRTARNNGTSFYKQTPYARIWRVL